MDGSQVACKEWEESLELLGYETDSFKHAPLDGLTPSVTCISTTFPFIYPTQSGGEEEREQR